MSNAVRDAADAIILELRIITDQAAKFASQDECVGIAAQTWGRVGGPGGLEVAAH